MSDIYEKYTTFIQKTISTPSIYNFKSNDSVTYMLEHTSFYNGMHYLNYISNQSTLTPTQIFDYCKKNDEFGGGTKFDYGIITTSPSNFRYLFHAHLILNHMKTLGKTNVTISEVGCGYGGLFLAIMCLCKHYNIKINKYYLIDLPDVTRLQQWYISNHNIDIPIEFHSAETYGELITDNDLFLISNYCFSEILDEHQKKYIEILFPKVSHGFLAWNNIPTYNFGFDTREEVEYPLTGDMNKYVYF